jgi:anti-anti-sigma regulatory factor
MRVEGRVTGPWVGELSRQVAEVLQRSPALVLDLQGVTFMDPDGVRLLQSIRDDGRTELTGGSTFVVTLLDGERA